MLELPHIHIPNRIIIAIAIMMLLVFVAVYFIFDPSDSRFFPKCGFYLSTGYKCPGCGSQRMIHSLLHLDFLSALRYNAYMLTVFPLLLALLAWNGWMKFMNKKWVDRTTWVLSVLLIASVLLWWLLRNVFNW